MGAKARHLDGNECALLTVSLKAMYDDVVIIRLCQQDT